MQNKEELIAYCRDQLPVYGFHEEKYKQQLELELKEIEAKMEFDYFIDLFNSKSRFAENENNLISAKLLGLVENYDDAKPTLYEQGEFPDIDLDYLPLVQKYLKKEWAPKTFGADRVCSIGNYAIFKIKSSLVDMARVFNKSRSEILDITTKIGLKDDEGKAITWDAAMRLYPALQKYCDDNPDVARATKRLLHRNRSRGKHAAGLIISSVPLDEFVPICADKEGNPVSAFVEGLSGTDLGPMGLIKFDLLVITNILSISKCCHLIKQRHPEIIGVSALPDLPDWSDIAYLNDPKALKLADEARLKCVFQFDGQGIQGLVKRGGVTSFEDLVAYSSIYRPGPLNMGMDKRYTERKRGREKFTIHPLLQPILGTTYGVMCYQEQVMKMLNKIGEIPDMHCEIVRKAISKKKIEIFGKYKEMFIKNGQKNLSWSEKEVLNLWEQIESFAEYGFNRSHAVAYTYISSRLIYLKAHYPLEFFAAVLSCEDKDDKMKEYKTEAKQFGIAVERVTLNKSKEVFEIVDDKIYMGFGNIKGIGEEPAKRIVESAPYTGLEDFLNRFGTDKSTLKTLIPLQVFGPEVGKCWAYYKRYKKHKESQVGRRKRYWDKVAERTEALQSCVKNFNFTDEQTSLILEELGKYPNTKKKPLPETFDEPLEFLNIPALKENAWLEVMHDISEKHIKGRDTFNTKEADDEFESFDDFDYDEAELLEDKDIASYINAPIQAAENEFYGFSWEHIIERSAEYEEGRTYADFEADEHAAVRMVQVWVVQKPKKTTAKTGTVYYDVMTEDANSRLQAIRFWSDDYDRFKEELEYWEDDDKKGHFLSVRLKRPSGGYNNYSFDAPPKQYRWRDVPKDKKMDARLLVLARPEKVDVPKPAPKPIRELGNKLIELNKILEF